MLLVTVPDHYSRFSEKALAGNRYNEWQQTGKALTRFIFFQHLHQRDNFCLHHLPLASSHFSLLFNSPSEYYNSLRCQIECSVVPYKTKGSLVHATMTYDLKSIFSATASKSTLSQFRRFVATDQHPNSNHTMLFDVGKLTWWFLTTVPGLLPANPPLIFISTYCSYDPLFA